MNDLALLGGSPLITHTLKPWNQIGLQEEQAVMQVLKSGVLSGFIANATEAFYGGPQVVALEKEWATYFKTNHAIAVNSATSGLYAALGAVGIGPGDEVIVTPTSMSASATAPLVYGAIPVFADINPHTFTLDPQSVEKKITPKTRAILVVNLFGHPAALNEILALANKHHLFVIEDNAQAPGALYKRQFAGTLGHFGVFSLNRHKHIQCGEGGIMVTNDKNLALRAQLIRNHAEAVVDPMGITDLTNMVGFNYRMTELEAAVARIQLQKLDSILKTKISQARLLTQKIASLEGLIPPHTDSECDPVYYTYTLRAQPHILGISRDTLVKALQAEGVPIVGRYVKPLYLSPLFQKQIAYGKESFPFNLSPHANNPLYPPGLCPVAEKLYHEEIFYIPWCSYDFSDTDIDLIAQAFKKVISNKNSLKNIV